MFAQDFFDFSSSSLTPFALPSSSSMAGAGMSSDPSTPDDPSSSIIPSPTDESGPNSGPSTSTAFKWDEDWLSLEQPSAPTDVATDGTAGMVDYDVPMDSGSIFDAMPASTDSSDGDVLNVTSTQLWSTPDAFACFASGGAHFADTLGAIGSASDQHIGLQNSSKFLWTKPTATVKQEQPEAPNTSHGQQRPKLLLKGLSSPETSVDMAVPSGSTDDFSDIVTPDLVQVLNLSSAGLSCEDVLATPDVDVSKDYTRFYHWPAMDVSSKGLPGLIPFHEAGSSRAQHSTNDSHSTSCITPSVANSRPLHALPDSNSSINRNYSQHGGVARPVSPPQLPAAGQTDHFTKISLHAGRGAKLSHFYNHFTQFQQQGHAWHGHSQLQDRRALLQQHGLTTSPSTSSLTAMDTRGPNMTVMEHIMASSAAMAASSGLDTFFNHTSAPSHLVDPTPPPSSASSTSSSAAFFPTTIDNLPGAYNHHGAISAAVEVIPPPLYGYDAAVAAGAADTMVAPIMSIMAGKAKRSRRNSTPNPLPAMPLPVVPPPAVTGGGLPPVNKALFAEMTPTILSATGGRNAKVLQAFLEGGEAAAQAAAAELKPAKRKRRRPVPKDSDKYVEMRRKNNISSQKCRANRKQRSQIQVQHMQNLETENRRLRGVLTEVSQRVAAMKVSVVEELIAGGQMMTECS